MWVYSQKVSFIIILTQYKIYTVCYNIYCCIHIHTQHTHTHSNMPNKIVFIFFIIYLWNRSTEVGIPIILVFRNSVVTMMITFKIISLLLKSTIVTKFFAIATVKFLFLKCVDSILFYFHCCGHLVMVCFFAVLL